MDRRRFVIGSAAAAASFTASFAQDAYHRYQVSRQLDQVMDSQDRAAFRQWNGDAASFAKTLYERCELTNGRGAAQCQRYRSVLQ